MFDFEDLEVHVGANSQKQQDLGRSQANGTATGAKRTNSAERRAQFVRYDKDNDAVKTKRQDAPVTNLPTSIAEPIGSSLQDSKDDSGVACEKVDMETESAHPWVANAIEGEIFSCCSLLEPLLHAPKHDLENKLEKQLAHKQNRRRSHQAGRRMLVMDIAPAKQVKDHTSQNHGNDVQQPQARKPQDKQTRGSSRWLQALQQQQTNVHASQDRQDEGAQEPEEDMPNERQPGHVPHWQQLVGSVHGTPDQSVWRRSVLEGAEETDEDSSSELESDGMHETLGQSDPIRKHTNANIHEVQLDGEGEEPSSQELCAHDRKMVLFLVLDQVMCMSLPETNLTPLDATKTWAEWGVVHTHLLKFRAPQGWPTTYLNLREDNLPVPPCVTKLEGKTSVVQAVSMEMNKREDQTRVKRLT